MTNEGPLLEKLTHRLAECPAEFLDEPRIAGRGHVHVDAVVADLLADLGGQTLTRPQAEPFLAAGKQARNYLRLVLVGAWLLHDEWFLQSKAYSKAAYDLLRDALPELAELVAADRFITDPDRREELARLCLQALNLRPQGETPAQAADRLKTLGSVERSRVIQATRAAQERARQIKQAMKEKAAREAAAKVSHE